MEIVLEKDFVERIAQLSTYEQAYAALWIISGIEYACREEIEDAPQENGSAIQTIAKISNYPMHTIDIYKLGYVQALVDLERPLAFNNNPYTSQEFRCRGFDALGINVLDKNT